MKYWDLTKDERDAWRKDDVTKLFMQELHYQRESYAEAALSDLLSGQEKDAYVSAGRESGVARAIDIAEDDSNAE